MEAAYRLSPQQRRGRRGWLTAVADAYDLPVSTAERAMLLAEYLRHRLGKTPATGDRLQFDHVHLVVREMEKEAITSVGVILAPESLALLPKRLRLAFDGPRGRIPARWPRLAGRLSTWRGAFRRQ
jgi:hypothetical protein